MSHTQYACRNLTDSELRFWSVEDLYDLAGMCDVEPADPLVCDPCAAYMIGQEKEDTLKAVKKHLAEDWTAAPSGRTNSSPAFLHIVDEVERLIRNDAHTLINGDANATARLIVAQLAHVHHLAPKETK